MLKFWHVVKLKSSDAALKRKTSKALSKITEPNKSLKEVLQLCIEIEYDITIILN